MAKGIKLVMVVLALVIVSGQEEAPGKPDCPSEFHLQLDNCGKEHKRPDTSSIEEVCKYEKAIFACAIVPAKKCSVFLKETKEFDDDLKNKFTHLTEKGCIPKYFSEAEIRALASGSQSVDSIAAGMIVSMIILLVVV